MSSSAMDPNSPLAQDQDYVWRDDSIIKAINIAEKEMIEKEVQVFSESCEMYAGGGKCLEGGKCENCDRVKKFKQKLME